MAGLLTGDQRLAILRIIAPWLDARKPWTLQCELLDIEGVLHGETPKWMSLETRLRVLEEARKYLGAKEA